MRRTLCALVLAAGAAGVASGCGDATPVTQPLAPPLTSRGPASRAPTAPRYDLVTYPSTLGGPSNRANAINDRGWIAGFSSLPDGTRHAALWRGSPRGGGALTDLGTLGGPNSSVVWPGLNDQGVAVGIAQTATPDPFGEEWSCSAFFAVRSTGPTCLGFVWQDGVMTALPTLGGNNGYATAVNRRGQVVGWAETAVHDPTCDTPQVLQFRAVRWEPGRRWRPTRTTELRPLPGDSASAATGINERGQVVGISGECDQAVGRFTAKHAVLWDSRSTPTELPNLGGTSWHTPTALNARGDAVGFSNPSDPRDAAGEFIARAVLWPARGGLVEIGRLPGDSTAQAQGINRRGQVVGVSSGNAGNRAFLWEDGRLYDLNALVAGAVPGTLVSARDINDAGQITGDLREGATGRTVPFVLTPARR